VGQYRHKVKIYVGESFVVPLSVLPVASYKLLATGRSLRKESASGAACVSSQLCCCVQQKLGRWCAATFDGLLLKPWYEASIED
jgi:hypothetical protein